MPKEKIYVGGWLDESLASELQRVADESFRGNRTFALETFIQEAIEQRKKFLTRGGNTRRKTNP